MRWLLFLSRLAFICGVFFMVAFSLSITNWIKDTDLAATIIIIGYLMGMIILPATNLCCLGVFLVKKKLGVYVPGWLVVSNIFFLLFLLYFIFYLNDPYYHQK